MASSQNDRYQERLAARRRGAGTHKIQNLGFSIQPLAPPARPAAPSAPPPVEEALPPPSPVEPPKQVTPPAGPVRRSPRTATPTPPPPPPPPQSSGEKRKAGPSSLRNETSSVTAAAVPEDKTPTAAPQPPRRVSPRTQTTPAITQARSSASPIDTPTKFTATKASVRANAVKPAVAAVTPVPRGKRTRQPSPGKFVDTPEQQARNGRSSSAVVDGVAESETSTVIERSPEGNKRRKVVKEAEASLEAEEAEEVDDSEDEEIVGEQTVEESMIEETADEEEKKAGADETMLETPVQDLDGSQPPPNSSPPLFLDGQDSSSEEEEEAEEQEEPDPEPTPQPKLKPQPKSKPAGKRAPPLPEPEEEEEEEDVDETPQPVSAEKDKNKQLSDEEREDESDSEVEEPTRRTTKKAPKATTTKKSSTTVRSSKPKPKPPKDTDEYEHDPTTFPVVVHRLAKAKGDAANTKLPAGSQRSGVNPVDVISQVSTELIDKLYQRLKTSVEKKAVESFKEELSLRFLELTDALEHSITLTDRVRKAQRRKNQLMGELLALKRERTQIAVQMDDVRRDHEAASKSSDTQIQTSQLFEEISGALERGKSRAQDGNGGDNVSANLEGLEGLVRRVSAIVTGGGGDGTGVLGKVVEFNRFLERAEKMLRERNAGIAAAR